QRQRLPLSPLRISSLVALGCLFKNARTATTKPGVQKPHCWASALAKALTTSSGWAPPRLSTVWIFLPLQSMASVVAALIGLPSSSTVEAPHEPSVATGLA